MKLIPVAVILLSGCVSGTQSIAPPAPMTSVHNSILVRGDRDSAWDALVPRLGKTFFVINTLEKSSGLLNVNYSGEPGEYLDCGTYTSEVKAENGKTDRYEFPAASAHERFQYATGSGAYDVIAWATWQMSLEGRANIVLEEVTPTSTRLTVTARYVVTQRTLPDDGRAKVTTATFSTGQSGTTEDGFLTCHPTGVLEQDILAAMTGAN